MAARHFQQNNERFHIVRRTIDFLQVSGINILLWPAQLLDFNNIEQDEETLPKNKAEDVIRFRCIISKFSADNVVHTLKRHCLY